MAVVNPRRTVYVGNLDSGVNEDLLRAAFIPFGDITSLSIPFDQVSRMFILKRILFTFCE